MKRMRLTACMGLTVCAMAVQGSSCGTTGVPNPTITDTIRVCVGRCEMPTGVPNQTRIDESETIDCAEFEENCESEGGTFLGCERCEDRPFWSYFP